MENLTLWLGGGSTAIALWVLKKIPNEKIKSLVFNTFYKLGVVATLGLSKWKITKSLWNKTIEPYAVDLIDNVVKGGLDGFIKGLRSDN
jgi:hypothetical protein